MNALLNFADFLRDHIMGTLAALDEQKKQRPYTNRTADRAQQKAAGVFKARSRRLYRGHTYCAGAQAMFG